MASGPGRGRDDDLVAEPPAFSDEGMRRIIYGQAHQEHGGQPRETGVEGIRDSRSRSFEDDTAELEADLRGRRSLVPVVTAVAALFCFGAIVWYAYSWGTGQVAVEELPVVRAEPMPEKVRPEQPGGLEVPHQGIAVLNQDAGGTGAPVAERLLPRPEEPAPLEPLPAETAQLPPEEGRPEVPEAPLMAEEGTAAPDADVTEAPELAPEFAEIPEPPAEGEAATALAEGGVAKPVPKPAPEDQIARLLEQQPLETANGERAEETAEIPEPPSPEPARPEPAAPEPATTQTAALTAGAVVVQLSSVKSEAAAQQEWQRLKAAHPGLLGSLPLSLEAAEVKGTTYYRVQTGPFPSRAAAAAVCDQLKARSQDCLVKQR